MPTSLPSPLLPAPLALAMTACGGADADQASAKAQAKQTALPGVAHQHTALEAEFAARGGQTRAGEYTLQPPTFLRHGISGARPALRETVTAVHRLSRSAAQEASALWLSPARRDALARRIRLLVAATITYNVIEAIVAITAGTLASSTALIGFGLDSVIEVFSAAAVPWQFSAADHAGREAREQRTLRITALSFFALAAYVSVDVVRALAGTSEADRSTPGIVIAALSLAVMPFLSAAQRRAGRKIGSASAVADSKQTLPCTYLSAVLLVGLIFNAALGWSWADPIAALVITAIAVKEGRDAWQGKGCCAPSAAVPSAADADVCGCRPGCDCCN